MDTARPLWLGVVSPLASFLAPVVHPIFVHFTTALFPTAALFATWSAWKKVDWARRAAYAVLVLAVVATFFTVVTGLVEHHPHEAAVAGTPLESLLVVHEWLGIGAEVYFAALLFVARRARGALADPWFAALLWTGVGIVLVGGWIGGRMVYEFGLGTPGGP